MGWCGNQILQAHCPAGREHFIVDKNSIISIQSYKDELASIKKDLDQVRRLGHQITEKVPEEKRSGVEKRVEEVFHEHRELDKKLLNKEEVCSKFYFLPVSAVPYSEIWKKKYPREVFILLSPFEWSCAREDFVYTLQG